MKRLITILFALCMLLSLAACAGNGSVAQTTGAAEDAGKVFMAGFGMEDITPTGSVNMAGYGDQDTRLSTGFVTYLDARAVAIQDENGDIMLFIVTDISFAYPAVGKEAVTFIEKKLGIPKDHIILAGTHTHNSVATWVTATPATVQFNEKYVNGCLEAAKAAIEDLKPAEVYVGSAQTEKLNAVRRYFMDDGSLCGDGTSGTGTAIISHETEADREVQLLKFVREGGKDILITNFQAHPHLEGKLSSISADTPAAIRSSIEQKYDVHSLHWQGAAGNLNSYSRIEGETLTRNRNEYGEAFASQIASGIESMVKVETGPIKVTSITYSGEANHTLDHLFNEALSVINMFNAGASIDDCTQYAKEVGLESFYHARGVVNHAKLPDAYEMDISAYSFGDVSGIVVPYEMFDTTGMNIKANTPFEKTFIIGYAYPGYQGYVPTEFAWEHGGYETWTSNYAPGNAEKLEEAYLGMLNELKGQ